MGGGHLSFRVPIRRSATIAEAERQAVLVALGALLGLRGALFRLPET
jgi:hypothetical protein